jgi:hypothetical protein
LSTQVVSLLPSLPRYRLPISKEEIGSMGNC